jgi:hypothetical protein
MLNGTKAIGRHYRAPFALQAGALPNSQPPAPGAWPLPVMRSIWWSGERIANPLIRATGLPDVALAVEHVRPVAPFAGDIRVAKHQAGVTEFSGHGGFRLGVADKADHRRLGVPFFRQFAQHALGQPVENGGRS